jgi:FdhD protein
MSEVDTNSPGLRFLKADRIATGAAPRPSQAEEICVIAESPLTLDVEGVETYTILCTPTDRRALAVGFLFTEGVIDRFADIDVLRPCADDPDTIRVRFTGKVPRLDDAGRNLLIVSSCGACGSEQLQKRIAALPRVGDSLIMDAGVLRGVLDSLGTRQPLFQASGGAHAALLFDTDGNVVASAEDAGRHNALDKAIGKCLLAAKPTAGLGVLLTSRLSLEMVSKCARAGIELVAGVSAATSLAIDVARACGITLCSFVRETRATVHTHPRRIVISGDS